MKTERGNAGRARAMALAVTLAVSAGMVIGCVRKGDETVAAAATAPNGAEKEDLYRVSADATSFFKYGPQQPSGPDLSLKKDARLVMLKRSFGYSQVRTEDNQVGYVGTVDITPLSAEELASERAAMAAREAMNNPNPGPNGKRRSPAIVGEYSIPPQAGNQERLPEPEVKPTPNPALFRY